jgi:hypothetical protein
LRAVPDGPILGGLVPGDAGYEGEGEVEGASGGGEKQEENKAKEDKFGEWWRARLVSEFESDLGGLAVVSFSSCCSSVGEVSLLTLRRS